MYNYQLKGIYVAVNAVLHCSARVKDKLKDTFDVTGLVKPGTVINTLTCTVKAGMENLTDNVLVFWGGTNDVAQNNSHDGLKHVVHFVKSNSHTSIILMCVPHRYDLANWSCANSEVKTFNRKLEKIMKIFKHVLMVKIYLTREHFTRHGLHMNTLGKEMITKQIVAAINAILRKKHAGEQISMPWKVKHSDCDGSHGACTNHQKEFYDVFMREVDEENKVNNRNQEHLDALSQVQLAVSASLPGPDRDSLVSLQTHIEELITLTKENLTGLQNQAKERDLLQTEGGDQYDEEYALLKAELEELETTKDNTLEPVRDDSSADIQEDLDALQGMKCQAPYNHDWGDVSYHNALVCAVEPASSVHSLDQIQVRVMFTNPTQRDMLPCPYYLEGNCRFSDEQCHFSHGKLVDLASLKEYREPDFSAVRAGVPVLVKCEDCLWHRAVVLTYSSQDKWVVKLESSGRTVEVALHCLLPLGAGEDCEHDSDKDDDDDDDDNDDSDFEVDPVLVQRSLLTTPTSPTFRDWEKYTRGIGSRLMARMGYVMGTGLGRNGEGRVEPVEALIFPPGKSLDHCMALREEAGGDRNLFTVEKRLRRQRKKHEQQSERQCEREKQQINVFDFINSKLGGKRGDVCDLARASSSASKPSSKDKGLKSESCHRLNVVGLRVGEEIRRAEKDLTQLRESLTRHVHGSPMHTTIFSKMELKQVELDKLRASECSINLEQSQRKDRKKLTVF